MSSLQVDSISSMGGGHVDGAGKVVQFKEAVNEIETTFSSQSSASLLTINFTPKFSDSLILCQGFHSQDAAVTSTSYGIPLIYAGLTEVSRAESIGYNITKLDDARFQYGYSGSIPSWGTTPLVVDLRVAAVNSGWTVSRVNRKTSLYVWEIAQ